MRTRHSPSRRGAGLLLVLATLILAVTASVAVARVASTRMAERKVVDRMAVADDLLVAVQAPIVEWLRSESPTVVLPPEVTTPYVEVLHDRWFAGTVEHEIQVAAWDQCGMVPLEVARSGSPMRLVLPSEMLDALDKLRRGRDQKAGLDLFAPVIRAEDGVCLFPVGDGSAPELFEEAFAEGEEDAVDPEQAVVDRSETRAIGAYIATHNPWRINVNTAPIDLVESAMRLAGRGGVEQIVQSRAEDEPAAVVSGRSTRAEGDARPAPKIAGESTAWAFRIDVKVGARGQGNVRRAWWAVYVRSGTSWECVQRLAITE